MSSQTLETETKARVTPELLMGLRRPEEVVVSADGTQIAFSVGSSFTRPGEPGNGRIWTATPDGGPARPPGDRESTHFHGGRPTVEHSRSHRIGTTTGGCPCTSLAWIRSRRLPSGRFRVRSRTSFGRPQVTACSFWPRIWARIGRERRRRRRSRRRTPRRLILRSYDPSSSGGGSSASTSRAVRHPRSVLPT